MTLDSALSGGDLTILRTKRYSTKLYLSFVPMTSFATARVNQINFPFQITEITVDTTSGNWLNIQPGMTVWIGSTAGAFDHGVYRVRKAPTSTLLYVMELSAGDPGKIVSDHPLYITDNAYVTVFLDFNAWSVFPRIAFSGGVGTFYKDWEIAYTTQNETTVPVALNLGEHKAGFVSAGVLAHTFTATYSAFDGTTITNYAFYVDETLQQSSASASFAHNYATGHHILRCVATLSTGATVTAYRNVWAHDPTTYPPLDITISRDTRNRKGRSIDLQLESAFDDRLLKGGMICVWEVPTWEGGSSISTAVTSCMGFIESIDASVEGGENGLTKDVRLSLISPLEMMGRLVSFEQIIRVTANPGNWQEILATLAHPDFFAFYILYWHSTLLRLIDYHPGGFSGYKANAWKTDAGDMIAQINRQLVSINAELTCDGTGSGLWVKRDPVMKNSTDRAAVIERMEIGSGDAELISYQKRVMPEYSKVDAYGFVTSTSAQPQPYHVQAYSNIDGQGGSQGRLEAQIIADVTDLRFRSTNHLVKLNTPIPRLTLRLSHGVDIWEPALWYFAGVNLPAAVLPEGAALDKRFVPEEVSMTYEGDGTRTITLTLSLETDGNNVAGEIIPLRGGNGIDDVDIAIPSYDDLTGLPVPQFDPFYAGTGISIGGLSLPAPEKAVDEGLPGTAIPSGLLILGRDRFFISGSDPIHEGQIHTINTPDLVPFTSVNIFTAPVYGAGAGNNYTEDIEILGSPAIDDPIPVLFLVQGAGVYHTSDAFGADPDPGLIAHSLGYNEIRVPVGSSNSFIIASHFWGKFYIEYNFLSSNHSSDGWSVTTTGSYSSGYVDGLSGTTRKLDQLRLMMGNNMLLSKIEVDYDLTPGLNFSASSCTLVSGETLANFSAGTNKTLTWVATTPFYHVRSDRVSITIVTGTGGSPDPGGSCLVKKVRIWGSCNSAGTAPTNYPAKVYYGYSGNLGATLTEHEVDDWDGNSGIDIDKFGLGCAVVAANKRLYRVSGGYGSTPIEITATLSGIDKIANKPSFIHIPVKKLASQADNNDPTSLMVLYGIDSLDGTQSTWATNINMNTGAVGTTSNITPTISGTRYFCKANAGGRALTTCDANTQKILAATNGGVLYSTDGGATWAVVPNLVATYVNQLRYHPGTDSIFWLFLELNGCQRIVNFVGNVNDNSLIRGRAGALL